MEQLGHRRNIYSCEPEAAMPQAASQSLISAQAPRPQLRHSLERGR